MFKKILVALDHSESCVQVFEQGLALAKAVNAHLMLVHVITPLEETYPISTLMPSLLDDPKFSRFEIANAYIKELEAFEVKGMEMLRSHADIARQQGVQTEYQQPSGYPGHILCRTAQAWNADVIVMGRRNRHILSQALLGSVSNHVTHHGPCSVLIVHNLSGSEFAEVQYRKRADKQFAEP